MESIAQKKNAGVTAERVIGELAAVAFANASDYVEVTDEGRVKIRPTEKLTKKKRAAIVGIRTASGGIEIKLGNKLQALQMLGRYLGAFEPDADIEDLEAARAEVFCDGGQS